MTAIYQRIKYTAEDKMSRTDKKTGEKVRILGWRFVAVEEGQGKSTSHLKPPFYARPLVGGKQIWKPLQATTFGEAKAEAEKIDTAVQAAAVGLTVQEVESMKDGGTKIGPAITRYLAQEIEPNKSAKTLAAYRNSLNFFTKHCHKIYLQEIGRNDMLTFKNWLRKSEGLSERSVYNNFVNVMTFFVWARERDEQLREQLKEWKVVLTEADWPKKVERDPEAYTKEEIKALLTAAEGSDTEGHSKYAVANERLLLRAFLYSGLRSGELEHLTYADIDFTKSIWKIRPKTDHPTAGDHDLKTGAAKRDVRVARELTEKVAARMKALDAEKTDLIFPNKNGAPNGHLIRIVKRVADRAGVTGRVDDHKFRATFITKMLRDGWSIPEVMNMVGHGDPKIVMRYWEKVQAERPEVGQKQDRTWAEFAGVGD